ncbi:MAG: dephospho-CoA kinase [Bacteroidales bacterium]|nr:dephospho-CoA kinase [Bacteroidales bacterium]
MLKVGLTGNIGSGKTLIAKIFTSFGINIFFADLEAKQLLKESEIKNILAGRFPPEIFDNKKNIINKKLAEIVFTDEEYLNVLNAIIHPRVMIAFQKWMKGLIDEQYILYEAAILFESGHHKDLDKVIMVSSPEELRIKRVMARDNISREEVLHRIRHQWPDEKKEPMADFIIINDERHLVIPQVLKIHKALIG